MTVMMMMMMMRCVCVCVCDDNGDVDVQDEENEDNGHDGVDHKFGDGCVGGNEYHDVQLNDDDSKNDYDMDDYDCIGDNHHSDDVDNQSWRQKWNP